MTHATRELCGFRISVDRVLGTACVAASLLAGTARPALAQPLARNRIDRRELEILSAQHPRAIPLLEEGEAALRAGLLEQAAARFEEARREAPDRALPARRHCQVMTALGRDSQANHSCTFAMAAVGSAYDARASVGAWLTKPRRLTPAELDQATTLADRAHQLSSHEPWGYAADCDIARRLGDRSMLKECISELSQIAPNHYETLRARAAASAFTSPGARWAEWAALCLVCVVTLLRAALSRFASRSPARVEKAGAAALLLLASAALTWSMPAAAETKGKDTVSSGAANASEDDLDAPQRPLGQLSTKFPIDLNNPAGGIPSIVERNKDPVQFGYWLMDLTVLADSALKKENYADAAKYFQTLVTAVPDRAIVHSKLCRVYLALKEREKALVPCKRALAFEGATVDDHLRYARLLISMPGQLAPSAISDIDAQVKHLQENGKLDAPANRIACELAVRLDDKARLETCTAGLVKAAPGELGTISFEWALALKQGNYSGAERLIVRAQELGMTPDGIEKMRAGTENTKPLWRLALANWRYVLGALLFGLAAVVLFVTWRRTSSGSKEQTA